MTKLQIERIEVLQSEQRKWRVYLADVGFQVDGANVVVPYMACNHWLVSMGKASSAFEHGIFNLSWDPLLVAAGVRHPSLPISHATYAPRSHISPFHFSWLPP
jgi:hypothetical protein